MDIIRGIMIGLGCFGLLVIGSCTMLGYGTMAVIGKAAEVAKKEQVDPDKQAEAIAKSFDHYAEEYRKDNYYSNPGNTGYSDATDNDYSDFGKPTTDIADR